MLEGLVQHYKLVGEADKSKVLVDLLDNLEFNQVLRSPCHPFRECLFLVCAAACLCCSAAAHVFFPATARPPALFGQIAVPRHPGASCR